MPISFVSSTSRRPSSVSAVSLAVSMVSSSLSTISESSSTVSTSSDVSFRSIDCGHGPMAVFCDTCSKALCGNCVTDWKHRRHIFKTLEDACEDKLDKMKQKLDDLAARDQSDIRLWVDRQEEQIQNTFQQVRERVTTQYTKLDDLLKQNKEKTLALLEALRQGQKKTVYDQSVEGDKYKEEAKKLQMEIETLNKNVSSNSNFACIKKIEDHQRSMDDIYDFFKRVPTNSNFDKTRLEALVKSVQCIQRKIAEMLPRPWEFYEEVTFNPDKANKKLKISHNREKVYISPRQRSSKDAETLIHILANQSWKDGRHYWEVDVENCSNWAVGVVELASGHQLPKEASQRHLGQDKKSWMLEWEDGELVAYHDDHMDIVKEQDLKRIGVFLDMTKNKNKLTFYNVGRNVALHTFYPRFRKSVFPAFSLSSEEGQVQSLVLCNLIPKSECLVHTDSDGESSRASSPMSDTSGYSSDSVSTRNSFSSAGPEMTQ